jgi:hypothetical protein
MQSLCNISYIGYSEFFRSTTQENNHIKLNRSFNLQVNQSVSLRIFQCLYCNTSITLTCDSLQKTVNISNSHGSKLVSVYICPSLKFNNQFKKIFSDSHLVNGWKESSLSNCGTQVLRNCNLTIQTLLHSATQVNQFWIIAQGKFYKFYIETSNSFECANKTIILRMKYKHYFFYNCFLNLC